MRKYSYIHTYIFKQKYLYAFINNCKTINFNV